MTDRPRRPHSQLAGTFLDPRARRSREPKAVLYARIVGDLHQQLTDLALEHGVSQARVVEDVLRLGLERLHELQDLPDLHDTEHHDSQGSD